MYGANPHRALESGPGLDLAVQSIFYTLQGEGPCSGVPAVFVRLAGCNLSCNFCDTEFESGINHRMTTKAIVEEIEARGGPARLVVLTGGEPLRQVVGPLIRLLYHKGYRIQVETAGTCPVQWAIETLPVLRTPAPGVDAESSFLIVCSPKTQKVNPFIEQTCWHWKYVVQADNVSPVDGLPLLPVHMGGYPPPAAGQLLYRARRGEIWLSPCDEQDPVKNKANQAAAVASCLKYGYRLSLQTHKIVGLEWATNHPAPRPTGGNPA